jgi:hypothetical protein
MLEEKRARIRAKVYDMTQNAIQCLIDCAKEHVYYMPQLSYSDSLDTTLKDLIESINDLPPEPKDSKDLLEGALAMLEKNGKLGLCFDCVRYGVIKDHECTKLAV